MNIIFPKIAETAVIHRTAVLEGDVVIGEGTVVGPLCYLKGPLAIGKNNIIHAHVVIGEEPEHRSRPPSGLIYIGDNNTLRELTVVQRGTGDRDTTIGNNCYIMDHCHIAHDCLVQNGVSIAPNTVMGGHAKIQEGATIGMGTLLHQFSTAGAYSMTGMGSVITKDIPPFCLVYGNPAKIMKLNKYVLERLGIDESDFMVRDFVLTTTNKKIEKYFIEFSQLSQREVLQFKAT